MDCTRQSHRSCFALNKTSKMNREYVRWIGLGVFRTWLVHRETESQKSGWNCSVLTFKHRWKRQMARSTHQHKPFVISLIVIQQKKGHSSENHIPDLANLKTLTLHRREILEQRKPKTERMGIYALVMCGKIWIPNKICCELIYYNAEFELMILSY